MNTARFDISGLDAIKRGTDRRIVLTFQNDDGSPFSLLGVSIVANIARTTGQPPISGFVPAFLNAAEGMFELYLSADRSLVLSPGIYDWELFLTFPSGETECPLQGKIQIVEKIL